MWLRFALLFVISSSLTLVEEPDRAPLPMRSAVQDKNFYVLSLLERSKELHAELEPDKGLARVRSEKIDNLKAAATCKPELTCYTQALKWTDDQIGAVEQSLRTLHRQSTIFREAVSGAIRTSGMYQLHSSLDDADLLVWAWKDAATG